MTASAATVVVRHTTGSYDVRIGLGLLDAAPEYIATVAPAFRYVIVADDRVAPLYAVGLAEAMEQRGMRVDVLTFPAGEGSKTRAEWARLTDDFLALGVGRDGAVVALGGGVTGDLAGFVAATYHRGIPVVQIPTSLVAMVDSAVGGKTGVDLPSGKNLVGAFHPPVGVLVDPVVVATLPEAERAQGLAEAVKHGAILDEQYFDALGSDAPALLAGDADATFRAVRRSVELKAGVVSSDEREGGRRQILNFGHTVGHAIEAACSYAIGHGTAVAAGMVLEAELGERLGITERGTRSRLEAGLLRFGLDIRPPSTVTAAAVRSYLVADKKARGGRPRYVLLEAIGVASGDGGWSRDVPETVVADVLRDALPGH